MWLTALLSQPGRTFRIATVISTALLAGTLFLFLRSWENPSTTPFFSVTSSFHIGIWHGADGPNIAFFNNAEYGPYRGSLIGLEGVVDPDLLRVSHFGMSYGVYYRYFQWTHTTLWTLMISMWYPLVAFSILPATWYYRFARRKPTR